MIKEEVYRILYWVGTFISPSTVPPPPPYKKNRSKEFSRTQKVILRKPPKEKVKKNVYMRVMLVLMIIFWSTTIVFIFLAILNAWRWEFYTYSLFAFISGLPTIVFTTLYLVKRYDLKKEMERINREGT